MQILETRIKHLLTYQELSFRKLMEGLWGVSPADLKRSLDQLSEQELIKLRENGLYYLHGYPEKLRVQDKKCDEIDIAKAMKKADKKIGEFLEGLPLPHLRDFDWRFSARGIRTFVEHLLRYHVREESICVISAPTIYGYLRYMNYYPNITLIERSERTVESIRSHFGDASHVRKHDLQYPWPGHISVLEDFSCIVMDPPWYLDYFEIFLARALEILSPGGLLHTALFPPFAKTSSIPERASIQAFAQSRGLSLIELRSCIIEYKTPVFEKRAMSIGAEVADDCWRRGDLATFLQGEKLSKERVLIVETEKFEEFEIGKSKFILRKEDPTKEKAYAVPTIESVEDGSQYLGNIKRSYALRKEIGLWTSCNQAFRIEGANLISLILKGIQNNTPLDNIIMEIKEKHKIVESKFFTASRKCYGILKKIIREEEGN